MRRNQTTKRLAGLLMMVTAGMAASLIVSNIGRPVMEVSQSIDSAPAPNTPAQGGAPTQPNGTKVTARSSAMAALMSIYDNRDIRRRLTIEAAKPQLTIGQDIVEFTISSHEGGHVYLLMVGADGKTFDLLFPNQIDRDNQIPPGAKMRLPRPNWLLRAEGPPGTNMLLAIVTDSPRDFSAAGLKPAGPFSSVNSLAVKDIQLVTVAAAKPAGSACVSQASTRNLAIEKSCSTDYAAALLPIVEVQSP